MGNIYIPPNDNKMLQQLDSELEHHTETPFIILRDFSARHPAIEMEKFWLMSSADNLEIHNGGINTFTHPNGSSIIDIVLTRNINNIKCQTKNLYLISTCYKGIETNLTQQTISINNKRCKTEGADWKKLENDITLSLSEGFPEG